MNEWHNCTRQIFDSGSSCNMLSRAVVIVPLL